MVQRQKSSSFWRIQTHSELSLVSKFAFLWCAADTDGRKNKKQCSSQLQCQVPCGVGNVVLPYPPCLPPVMLSTGGGGLATEGFSHGGGFGQGEGG